MRTKLNIYVKRELTLHYYAEGEKMSEKKRRCLKLVRLVPISNRMDNLIEGDDAGGRRRAIRQKSRNGQTSLCNKTSTTSKSADPADRHARLARGKLIRRMWRHGSVVRFALPARELPPESSASHASSASSRGVPRTSEDTDPWVMTRTRLLQARHSFSPHI